MAGRLGMTWIDLANAAWIATALALLACLAARVLRRGSPSAAHGVVAAASIAVLISPLMGLGARSWGLVAIGPPSVAATPQAERRAKAAPMGRAPRAEAVLPAPAPIDGGKATPAASPFVFDWLDVAVFAWVLGSLVVAGRQAFAGAMALRMRRQAKPAVAEVRGAVERLARGLGLVPPSVVESDAAAVPVALGPFRPLIVLPCGFADAVAPHELEAALLHELGHFAGRHHLAALLQAMAGALFWWNPALRHLGRVLDSLQEEVADDFVLAGGAERGPYAAFLVCLAERHSSRGPRVGLAIFAHRSALSRRIESLLRKERPPMTRVSAFGRAAIAIATTCCAALVAACSIRASEPPSTQEPGAPQQGARQAEGGGQSAGSFQVESFVKGRAVPVGKAEIQRPDGKPPTIVYPKSRTSTGWVETKAGTRVAVAEGVEWRGKVAYLSLTFDVVVADAKTKACRWSAPVGAFWDTITFEDAAKEGQEARWALVLKSSTKPEYQQSYDLDTGDKLELRGGPPMPEGEAFTPRKVWSGSAGVRDENLYRLVGKAEDWTALRAEIFGDVPKGLPAVSDIDWDKEMLLVCYGGAATNWSGIGVEMAAESDERVLLRLHRATYQTIGGVGHEHPYGLIVVPRREGKPHVLEYNNQGLIGGPPIWREFKRLSL